MPAGVHTGQVPVQTGWATGAERWLSYGQGEAAQTTMASVATNGRRRRSLTGVPTPGQEHVGRLPGGLNGTSEEEAETQKQRAKVQVLIAQKLEPKQGVL